MEGKSEDKSGRRMSASEMRKRMLGVYGCAYATATERDEAGYLVGMRRMLRSAGITDTEVKQAEERWRGIMS
jgi:hypothetical protein